MTDRIDETRKLLNLVSGDVPICEAKETMTHNEKLKDPVGRRRESNEAQLDKSHPLHKVLSKKLKELGVKKSVPNKLQTMLETIEKGKVDTSKFGLFGTIFENIDYEVKVGGAPAGEKLKSAIVVFELRFNWTHSDYGSNGHTYRQSYYEKDGKWSR